MPHLVTLQGINMSHLGKRKIIFKMPFLGDMLVSWRVCLFSQASFCKSAVPGWDFSSPSIGSHADCHWVGDDPKNYHCRQAGKSSQFYVLEYPSLLMHHLRPPTTIGYTHLIVTGILPLKTKRLHMIYSKAFHTFWMHLFKHSREPKIGCFSWMIPNLSRWKMVVPSNIH